MKKERLPSGSRRGEATALPPDDVRFVSCAVPLGLAGWLSHAALIPFARSEGWGGNGGWLDPVAHLSNSFDSMTLVSFVALLAHSHRLEICTAVSPKKACAIAGIALAAGVGLNVVAETPSIDHSAVMPAFLRGTTDPIDAAYGDAASVATAAFLALSMKKKGDQTAPLGDVTLPTTNDLPQIYITHDGQIDPAAIPPFALAPTMFDISLVPPGQTN